MMTVKPTFVRVTKIIITDAEKMAKDPEWRRLFIDEVNKFNESEGDLFLEVTPCVGDDVKTALLMGDYEYHFPKSNPYSEDVKMLITSLGADEFIALDVDI